MKIHWGSRRWIPPQCEGAHGPGSHQGHSLALTHGELPALPYWRLEVSWEALELRWGCSKDSWPLLGEPESQSSHLLPLYSPLDGSAPSRIIRLLKLNRETTQEISILKDIFYQNENILLHLQANVCLYTSPFPLLLPLCQQAVSVAISALPLCCTLSNEVKSGRHRVHLPPGSLNQILDQWRRQSGPSLPAQWLPNGCTLIVCVQLYLFFT